jgi:hypothetical protein
MIMSIPYMVEIVEKGMTYAGWNYLNLSSYLLTILLCAGGRPGGPVEACACPLSALLGCLGNV